MSKKKGVIGLEKLAQLQKGGVYTISCCVDGCACDRKSNRCPRGFFSLFIQAVYGIEVAQCYGLPHYVSFGNCTYLYTDPRQEETNFWNYYFKQADPWPKMNVILNSFEEVYPLRIWARPHFRKINREVIGSLAFKEEVKEKLKVTGRYFEGQTVLGVQIRRTDHADETLPISLKKILKTIDSKIAGYDKLFVATDDSHIIKLLEARYGEKLLYNEAIRSEGRAAVHTNLIIEDRYRLGLEVLLDCYCLSLCKEAILMHSNISYAALFFNPNLPYTLLERLSDKRSRLKTLLLYYLDRMGIRKW